MNEKEIITSNEEEVVENKEITLEDIENLSNMVHIESMKHNLNHQADQLHEKQKSFYSTIKGYDSENDFINERLKNYTVDELETKLKNDDFVESFFIDPITKEPMEMTVDFENDGREIEFKRGLLTYFKSTQEAFDKIDEEYHRLDEFTREIQNEIDITTKTLSDNVLAYIDLLTTKAESLEDVVQKRNLLETIRHIRSGYDMNIFSEALDKHPTIIERCVTELNDENRITSVGKRYLSKLKTHKVKVSLIEFASDITSNKKSFEELVLVRGDQYIIPDLFVYSLIRFFSMADWNNSNMRKAHASICLVIRKLLTNNMIDEVKTDVINNITLYLKKFNID